jgi:hypothetical protein
MQIPNLDGLPSYPANWDEASKDVAMYADVTAGYYARACAVTDTSDKGMFADVIAARLAEINRRGWGDRVEKYLDVSGSTFDLRHMDAWAHRARREAYEAHKARIERAKSGGNFGGGRSGGHRRFSSPED